MADKLTKLSQAIRLGSTFRPQSIGMFYDYRANSSCVLGAAYEAAIGEPYQYATGQPDPYDYLENRFGVPGEHLAKLADRNNSGESRESIADDLERQGL